MLQDLLNYYKAEIHVSTSVKEIREHTVVIESNGTRSELPADTVVLAVGYAANDALYTALKDCGKELYLIGDARKSPGNILHAVADGNEVGRKI